MAAQRHALARAGVPEEHDGLLVGLEGHVQREAAEALAECRRGSRARVSNSRSLRTACRSSASRTNATTSRITDSAIAPASPWLDSKALMIASGIVCVRPSKLPAKMSVAPSSLSARTQHSTAPPMSAGRESRSVMRQNVRSGDTPSVADTCS